MHCECWLAGCLGIRCTLGEMLGRQGQEVAKGPRTRFKVYTVLLIDKTYEYKPLEHL